MKIHSSVHVKMIFLDQKIIFAKKSSTVENGLRVGGIWDKRERLVYTIADLKPSPQDPGLASARGSKGARERALARVCSGPTATGICSGVGKSPPSRDPRPAIKAFTQVPAVRAVDWRSKAGPGFKTSGAAAGRRKGAEIASGRRPGPDAKAKLQRF